MASLGTSYAVEMENTEKQGGGGGIIPHMNALIQVESATPTDTKDQRGTQVELTFEVLEPEEFKGRKFWAYWTVLHADGYQYGQYKYGKPMFDRLLRATGVDPDEFSRDPDTDHVLFRSFAAEIGIQIGNKKDDGTFYKDKNQIDRFYFNDDLPGGSAGNMPELGVIGDGTQSKKRNEPTAANDNRRPAANDNRQQQATARPAAAATGSRPWGQKK